MAVIQKFSILELVNIMRSLELGGYVFQHQKDGTSYGIEYFQLPWKVTISYLKLQASVQSEELKSYYQPEKELINFLEILTKYARFNHWYYPSAEKAHAEYLLGFLLQQDFTIVHDNVSYELNKMIYRFVPDIEKQGKAHYWFEEGLIPPEPHDFLSESWREKQAYPPLQVLETIWHQHVAEIESKKQQAALVAEQAAQREREQQKAYANWRETHFFDNNLLDYKNFSFVLEAVIKSGCINLFAEGPLSSPNQNKISLSLPLTQLLLNFSQSARNIQSGSLWSYQQAASNFERVLCELIASSKYDLSQHGESARQLVGFLLFHNFQIQHGNTQICMREIFFKQATWNERELFLEGHHAHPCSFIYLEWQQQQNYPGKQALEIILQREQQQPVVSQNKTFLNAFPNYQHNQSQPQLQPQSNQMINDACYSRGSERRNSF